MKKLIKIFTLLIAFVSLVTLASCGNKGKGTLEVLEGDASRIDLSITFTATFEDGDIFVKDGATAYVMLYSGQDYKSTENISFTNSEKTEGQAKFTKLQPGVTYTGKLYYTLEGTKNFVAEAEATIDSTGDESKPIEISNKQDFLNMSNDLSAHYKLVNDIDFTLADDASSYDKISVFTSSKIFKGTFDGNGHTIKDFGLTSNTYMGLFGYTDGATIKNLNIENVAVDLSSAGRGETYMGAVVGKAVNTTIENVTVKNVNFKFKAYTTAKVSLGGFAGRLESTNVTNCSVDEVSIDITHARLEMALGLFAGYSEGSSKIEKCNSKGTLSACVFFSTTTTTVDYLYAGGFVGVSDATEAITDCYTEAQIKIVEDDAKNTVSTTHRLSVGGFVGGNLLGGLKTSNCLAVVDMDVTTKYSNNSFVGGFAGRVIHSSSKISNGAYVALENGIVVDGKAEDVKVSLLVAYMASNKIENLYAYTDKIVAEGITINEVTPVTPDENLNTLKTTVGYTK